MDSLVSNCSTVAFVMVREGTIFAVVLQSVLVSLGRWTVGGVGCGGTAKVKEKAQTCAFNKDYSNCNHSVDYTDEIVKYVVISGIADEEIKKEVLGIPDLDTKSLNETITTKEQKNK